MLSDQENDYGNFYNIYNSNFPLDTEFKSWEEEVKITYDYSKMNIKTPKQKNPKGENNKKKEIFEFLSKNNLLPDQKL